MFCRKVVLENFAKFTEKHLWCFAVNFAKFLRTSFFIEHVRWLLLRVIIFCHLYICIIVGMLLTVSNILMQSTCFHDIRTQIFYLWQLRQKKIFFWFELLIVRWIWIILSVVLWNNFVQKFNDFIGDHSFSTFAKFSEKLNISYPLIPARTCAYQGVRNVSFSGNFANILNEWSICIFQLFLNIFLAMFPFYKPWAAENLVFLVFSGGVKW